MTIQKKQSPQFQPIELTITIESQSELDTLLTIANTNSSTIWDAISLTDAIGHESCYKTWDNISTALFDILEPK